MISTSEIRSVEKATATNVIVKEAFVILCQSYAATLLAAICHVLENNRLAKEAFQNTFTKIWLHWNSYDCRKEQLAAWMLNIASKEAIQFLPSKPSLQAGVRTPLEEDIYKLLFLLKPINRNILELCISRGFTHNETAEILDSSRGIIKA